MSNYITDAATPTPKAAGGSFSHSDWNTLRDDTRAAIRSLVINPLHYGCVGNGSTNDDIALQAILTAAAAETNVVIDLQGLTYLTATQLELFNTFGVWIINGTLKWDGADGTTNKNVLQYTNTHQCGADRLGFVGSTNVAKPSKGMLCLHSDANRALTYGRSNNVFRNCGFGLNVGEYGKYGVLIDAEDDASNGNNDFHSFYDCISLGGTQANYSIEAHQSVGHLFSNCKALSNGLNTPYGVTNTLGGGRTGGSFSWMGGAFGGHQTSDVYVTPGNGATFWIGGTWVSEGSKRFLMTAGPTTVPGFVTVEGGRWSMDSMNADGNFVILSTCGGVSFRGLYVDGGGAQGTTPPRILLNNGTVNDVEAEMVNCHVNYWDTSSPLKHPFAMIPGAAGKNSWYLQGNKFINGGGNFECRWDTEGVSGQVTVAAGGTTGAVTFLRAEPDAEYRVRIFPDSVTGSPASGAEVVTKITSKATTGFTVNVRTDPGGAAAQTFNWQIYRYPYQSY